MTTLDELKEWRDAGKRCSDEIRLHIAMGNAGRWAAIRLSDGGSDHVAYETRADAMLHQLTETQCAYVKIPPDDMPPDHAARYLLMNRKLYDAGMRIKDPDQPSPIMPMNVEDMRAALRNPLKVRFARGHR